MSKTIDSSVIEEVKFLCYDIVLGEMINSRTMSLAKDATRKYLDNHGYKINWVKCDEENNPPGTIDSGNLIVTVSEHDFRNPQREIIHDIVL